MSSIVTAITGGGGAGDAYKPSSTNILQPANTDQANQLYGQTQQGLTNQQNFLNALQAQNGVQNQSNVFNQQQGVANGTGPNPAQNMLNQSTGANVANQAALMAGQRGSGANAGLIARQAAQQGANTQQQSAGQAATMQSQQQLGALNQLGSLATNQVQQNQNAVAGYNQAAQGAQQNTLGAIGAQNNANVGMQSNLNNVSGQLNTAISGQQGALIGNLAGGLGAGLATMLADGGEVEDPSLASDTDTNRDFPANAETDNTPTMDSIDAQRDAYAIPTPGVPAQTLDQTKAALSAAIPGTAGISNGAVKNAPGPQSSVGRHFMQQQDASKPQESKLGAGMSGGTPGASQLGAGGNALGSLAGKGLGQAASWIFGGGLSSALSSGSTAMAGGFGDAVGAVGTGIGTAAPVVGADAASAAPYAAAVAAKGGRASQPVKAMLSPGEKYLTPQAADKVAKGKADPMKSGKTVPGKPKVKGAKDSYANDTVPANLEEGGIVLPRSVTQSKNPEWAAHKFVRDVMAKKGMGLK